MSQLLEGQDANELGLNVIWIGTFDDLPTLSCRLRRRETDESPGGRGHRNTNPKRVRGDITRQRLTPLALASGWCLIDPFAQCPGTHRVDHGARDSRSAPQREPPSRSGPPTHWRMPRRSMRNRRGRPSTWDASFQSVRTASSAGTSTWGQASPRDCTAFLAASGFSSKFIPTISRPSPCRWVYRALSASWPCTACTRSPSNRSGSPFRGGRKNGSTCHRPL